MFIHRPGRELANQLVHTEFFGVLGNCGGVVAGNDDLAAITNVTQGVVGEGLRFSHRVCSRK